MLRKAKLLFDCNVYLQSVVPIPGKPPGVADSVYNFNNAAVKACKSEKCYYLDVFNEFLDCVSFEKYFRVYPNNTSIDIHPNRLGMSILARAYISVVRDKFDPFYRY